MREDYFPNDAVPPAMPEVPQVVVAGLTFSVWLVLLLRTLFLSWKSYARGCMTILLITTTVTRTVKPDNPRITPWFVHSWLLTAALGFTSTLAIFCRFLFPNSLAAILVFVGIGYTLGFAPAAIVAFHTLKTTIALSREIVRKTPPGAVELIPRRAAKATLVLALLHAGVFALCAQMTMETDVHRWYLGTRLTHVAFWASFLALFLGVTAYLRWIIKEYATLCSGDDVSRNTSASSHQRAFDHIISHLKWQMIYVAAVLFGMLGVSVTIVIRMYAFFSFFRLVKQLFCFR